MVNVTAQFISYFSAKFNCQRGHLTYERIPNHKLIGFQDKVVSALSSEVKKPFYNNTGLILTDSRRGRPSRNGTKLHILVQYKYYRQQWTRSLWIFQLRVWQIKNKADVAKRIAQMARIEVLLRFDRGLFWHWISSWISVRWRFRSLFANLCTKGDWGHPQISVPKSALYL